MTRPFPFQREDASAVQRFGGRALISSEMGTGKSLTSLLYAKRNPELRPAVVVCPASVKWNWCNELAKHYGWLGQVIEGTNPKKWTGAARADWWVINYDVLYAWLGFFKAVGPRLVIVDECHKIAHRSTRQSKAVRGLCEGVENVLALSGTPLVNRPAELWNVLNLLRPDLYPSFWTYGRKWCAPRVTPWGLDFSGSSNLPRLHRQLKKQLMIRRRKADVLGQLPPLRRSVVPLPMTDAKDYLAAEKDVVAWLAQNVSLDKAKRASRAKQLVRVGVLMQLAARAYLQSVKGWVEDYLAGGGKLVLFGVHTEFIEEMHKHFRGDSVMVHGGVSGRKRQLAFDQLTRNKRCRILVGNVEAAGTGWSAKGVSDTAFFEYPWSPGKMSQAEGRTHGIGRGQEGRGSTAWWLMAKGTIHERMVSLLQRKARDLDTVLDGDNGVSEMDVFEQLVLELAKGGRT